MVWRARWSLVSSASLVVVGELGARWRAGWSLASWVVVGGLSGRWRAGRFLLFRMQSTSVPAQLQSTSVFASSMLLSLLYFQCFLTHLVPKFPFHDLFHRSLLTS